MKLKVEIQPVKGPAETVHVEITPAKDDSLLESLEPETDKIAYGCRVGSCGTCMIEIIEGSESLAPPTPQEEDTLSRIARNPNCRLACRARLVESDASALRIRCAF